MTVPLTERRISINERHKKLIERAKQLYHSNYVPEIGLALRNVVTAMIATHTPYSETLHRKIISIMRHIIRAVDKMEEAIDQVMNKAQAIMDLADLYHSLVRLPLPPL